MSQGIVLQLRGLTDATGALYIAASRRCTANHRLLEARHTLAECQQEDMPLHASPAMPTALPGFCQGSELCASVLEHRSMWQPFMQQ